MKKQKRIQYDRIANLKGDKHRLGELGEAGWRLVAVDDGDGICSLEDSVSYEYRVIKFDLRPRRDDMDLQEILDTMQSDGWRLVSALQGPQMPDSSLVFEREI